MSARARRGHTFAVCNTCDGERQGTTRRYVRGQGNVEMPAERPKDDTCYGCQRLLRRAERIIGLHEAAQADRRLQTVPLAPHIRSPRVSRLTGWSAPDGAFRRSA